MGKREVVLIKLGGSIISNSKEELFDIGLAKNIKNHLIKFKDTHQFIIVVGGGELAKLYQNLLRENGVFNNEDLDWAGVSTNNHNAMMLKIVLGDYAEKKVLMYENIEGQDFLFDKTFQVAGADQPGHSGDTDTVILARRAGAKQIFSLKNVDGVYSADPKVDPEAVKYDSLSWEEYRKNILGTDIFTPKMAVPVDPVASKMAEESGIQFIIVDGSDLDNLEKAIKSENFVGTTIG